MDGNEVIPNSVTIRVPATFEGVGDAVMTAREFLDALPLPERAAARFELALAEAVNNVVEHARCSQNGSVEITIASDDETLRLVVSDDGRAADLDGLNTFMTLPLAPEAIAGDGHGVRLIHSVMDQAIYSRQLDRNVLTMAAALKTARG